MNEKLAEYEAKLRHVADVYSGFPMTDGVLNRLGETLVKIRSGFLADNPDFKPYGKVSIAVDKSVVR